MSDQTSERRRFSRIPFNAVAHLNSHDGDLYLHSKVLDVSLKGLLIERPDNWQSELGKVYQVDLLLENGNVIIKMEAAVAHVDKQSIGFNCTEIDLDSITHLKRLVELNLGDESLLQRELVALLKQQPTD